MIQNNTTIVDTINEDGSITRTFTTVRVQKLDAEQIKKQQESIENQIDLLSAKLEETISLVEQTDITRLEEARNPVINSDTINEPVV
jgi:hypothetical protein